MLRERNALPLGEGGLEVRQLQSLGPQVLVGSALHLEHLKNLVNLRVPSEKGSLLSHFSKDAADRPDVNRGRILLLS